MPIVGSPTCVRIFLKIGNKIQSLSREFDLSDFSNHFCMAVFFEEADGVLIKMAIYDGP